jgi:hypothetical protein
MAGYYGRYGHHITFLTWTTPRTQNTEHHINENERRSFSAALSPC